MKTKTVIVTWTEKVYMWNYVTVPEDWIEKDIFNHPDGIMFDGAKSSDCEVEVDSVNIAEVLEGEDE